LEKRAVTDIKRKIWEARSDFNTLLISLKETPDPAQIEYRKREI
jgi:hypothetical protein